MTTAVFPDLPGVAMGIKRSAKWLNRNYQSVSGKETNVALWSYPEWSWSLPFEVLQTIAGSPDFWTLANFYNAQGGDFAWWLYSDPDDCAITGQPLGDGDGATAAFQLVRAGGYFGGFVEPIWAPNRVGAVYVSGVQLAASAWSVSPWGGAAPGVLSFAEAPPAGALVTADFSWYFVCRFTDGQIDFSEIAAGLWSVDKLAFKAKK